MAKSRRRRADDALRPAMRSPGRPTAGRREHRERFWEGIARGLSRATLAMKAAVQAIQVGSPTKELTRIAVPDTRAPLPPWMNAAFLSSD